MALKMRLEETGIAGPISIFSASESHAIKELLMAAPSPVDWGKGHAANSMAFYNIASHPGIVDRVAEILGDAVMLWGSSLIRKKPGQSHPWHTDIETSDNEPGTVTVWVGLENTTKESSLRLIPYSHRFGITIQERASREGKTRKEITADDVLGWARELDPRCEVVQFDMADGDAVLFDGRLWHGSLNMSQEGVRTAVLLQYASPERAMRMADFSKLDFPFRLIDEPRPPCVMVRGTDSRGLNRIVPAPTSEPPPPRSWLRSLRLPLAEDERTGWRRYPIFRGSTGRVGQMRCHASVLSPDRSPHEPHSHADEELLIILEGEAELVIVGGDGVSENHRVGRGHFVYYPSDQVHTIYNSSAAPVTYLMFKWQNATRSDASNCLGTQIFQYPIPSAGAIRESGRKKGMSRVFQGPTKWLRRLHCHTTTLLAGGGYKPHVDSYDVAIVVLAGAVETLGERLEASDIVYYPAGAIHGMRNPGEAIASYLVFEFHGDAGNNDKRRDRNPDEAK